MAKLVYGMNMSLDGYIDHQNLAPSAELFGHFMKEARAVTASIYGRRMYEVMRYWDQDQPDWEAHDHEFAALWRGQPKWVVSRTLKSVGPNATLVADDVEAVVRGLKARVAGELEVAGPELAGSLSDLGLIDEYKIYLHPVVTGGGKPYFTGPRPRLHLAACEQFPADVLKLTYVPA